MKAIRAFTFAILTSCALLVINGAAQTFSDANWVSLGGVSGALGPYGFTHVNAAAVDSAGNLYIGGSFTLAGSAAAINIAEWNGSNWCALGSGMNGDVNALVVSGTSLYAGGTFTRAGGVAATNIARWDGRSWSALGEGVSGLRFTDGWLVAGVNALAVSGTNLYVGGYFTNAGGVLVSNVAQWNGSSWSALGPGVEGHVYALTVANGKLYAAGHFVTADVFTPNNVAQWDGSTWSSLGPGLYQHVSALAVLSNTLYAGSDSLAFTNGWAADGSGLSQWNGSSWSAVTSSGAPMTDQIQALAVAGGKLYVGSDGGTVAQRTGSTWSTIGSGLSGSFGWGVLALAGTEDKLFVGGYFTSAGNKLSPDIAEAILVPSSAPPSILSTGASFGFTSGNSSFGFDVAGSQAQTVAVLASTNLVNWFLLQTTVLDGTSFHFSDPYASKIPRRFYRAKLLP